MIIDEFYIKAHGLGIPFDTATFNQLLKAVRLRQPEISGGLAAAYLNEMQMMNYCVWQHGIQIIYRMTECIQINGSLTNILNIF